MTTRILAASMLLFATIAPVAAQTAGTARAQREKALRAVEEALAAARADRSAATVQQRAVLEKALQAARADRDAGAVEQRAVLEKALQAREAGGAAAAMDRRIEREAALRALATDRQAALDELYGDGPRASWAPQDPADSLWRRAREQLNAGEYDQAAKLFHQIRTESRFAKSGYRPDAFYWEAFALTRSGGTDALHQARQILTELDEAYPPSQRSPDARALATRIDAELAGQGNVAAARDLYGRLAAVQNAEARAETLAAQNADRQALQSLLQAQQSALAEARTRNTQSSIAAGQVAATNAEAYRAYQEVLLSGFAPARGQSLLPQRVNPQCRNDDEEIRLIALNALVEMDDSTALPALRDVMARRDECAPPLRRQAMMIIARRASPGTESIALEAARNDPDPEVRQMALTWLVEKNNEQALDIAQSLLSSTEDRQLQQAAIMALARSRNDQARTILRDFVRSDGPVDLRGEAILALPLAQNAAATGFLRSLFAETSDKKIKEYALMALGRRSLEGDTDWLLGIAQDETEDSDLRTRAMWMLRADSTVTTTAIAAIYDRPGDQRLREAALMIIIERSRSDPDALDKLIAIARDEENADLRRQAVNALVRSKDPRAQAVLLEIIRKK